MSAKIYGPGEGIRTIDVAGSILTAKEDGSSSGDTFVVAEATLVPGAFEPPLHRHREIDESLYVLEGQLDMQVGDDRRIAGPGAFVSIPAGVPHAMSIAGGEPVRMLMILSNPARSMQMLTIMEEVFASGGPESEAAGPLLAQLDMEMLGPAPS